MSRRASDSCDSVELKADDGCGVRALPELYFESLQSRAREFFKGARGSHDWDHTLRVLRLCEQIGPTEGADPAVLRVAACLHDIGRGAQDEARGAICHAERGARMAEELVEPLPLSIEQKTNIFHCIRSHRFRGEHPPRTIEARVLFDADKLDAIGAVGIARAFQFAGEVGARLHNPDIDVTKAAAYSEDDTGYREFMVKLRRVRDRILTAEGRRLAEARHRFMEQFFEQFISEFEGKR